jgi:hypothetical protein
VVYPVGVVAAVGVSLLVGRFSGGSVVALALGLFAALLTAVTLVILLTLDVDSRWPSLQQVISESYLGGWFVLAMAAVSLAAFVDDSEAKWLTTLAIMLSLAGGLLGSYSLFHLMRISTGGGRERFLGGLLKQAAQRPAPTEGDAAEAEHFAAFLTRFRSAVDSGDVSALRERLTELAIAGNPGGACPRPLLALDQRVLIELGRAVLLGRLDSPDVGARLFPFLGEVLVDHALRLDYDADRGAAGPGAQREIAAYLGQASRAFAWIAGANYRQSIENGVGSAAAAACAAGVATARKHILESVDPEWARRSDASLYLPEGLTDPTAALAWWWSFCDLNGAHDGGAFYAAVWMLTGEKFYGTFGWGNRYLLSELEDRLRTHGSGEQAERRAESRRVIATLGGLQHVALDLLATSMAGWRDRRTAIPQGLEQNWTYWDDPRRLARRARLFLPRAGEPWLRGPDSAVDALGALLARGRSARSLGGHVQRHLAELPITEMPPPLETARRPAAAVLAVSLHLAPRSESDSPIELERFLKRLPTTLLSGADRLAGAILYMGDDAPPTDSVSSLVRRLSFLRYDQQLVSG